MYAMSSKSMCINLTDLKEKTQYMYAGVCNIPVQFTSVCKCVHRKSMCDVIYKLNKLTI